MALKTYPLDNVDYSAEDAELFHCTRSSGIYANDDFDYSVTGADNTITIGVGLGWIRNSRFSGKVTALKAALALDMGLPDAVYPRVDAVVIQFDANKNSTEIVAKQGVPASAPAAPAVSQTEALYELHLYHVRREPGAAAISVSSITDLRLDSNYCGLMADSVTRIDTDAIAAQAHALIEELRQEIQSVKDGSAYLLRSGGTMTGPINMNGQVLKGLNAPTADDQAANMGYVNQQVRKAAPRNLLDDSDFTDPVNPRGQTSYSGNWVYAIDRWQTSDNNPRVDILSDGIKLSSDTAAGATYIFQRLEKLHPGTYTFVAKFKGNAGEVSISNKQTDVGAAIAPTSLDTEGILILNFETPDELSSTNAFFRLVNSTAAIWEWAALYEGEYTAETLPKYQPKGYMVEALNCGALTVHKTLDIPASGWSSTIPYAQTVSLDGVSAEDIAHVSPIYSETLATALAQQEAWGMVSRAKTAANAITFYCFDEKPTTDISVQIEVNR